MRCRLFALGRRDAPLGFENHALLRRQMYSWKALFFEDNIAVQLYALGANSMQWTDRIGRRIKLRDLHVLLAVAQSGSMVRAAERLAISQPVVSKAIADLEHSLGVRLLERDRQGVTPTPYGLALIRRGAAVFDELKQGIQDIEFLADPTAGELRIGTTENMVGGFLPTVIDRITRQYPRVTFFITRRTSAAEQFRELRAREVDLIIGRLPKGPDAESDLDVQYLFDEPFLIAAGIKNRWLRRQKIALSELMDEPWVLPRPDRFVGALVADVFRTNGFDLPQKRVACSSMEMNNALLATGRYLAIYSKSYMRLSAKRLSIKVLPVNMPIASSPVGTVTLKSRMASGVARLFIDCAREVAKSQGF